MPLHIAQPRAAADVAGRRKPGAPDFSELSFAAPRQRL